MSIVQCVACGQLPADIPLFRNWKLSEWLGLGVSELSLTPKLTQYRSFRRQNLG